MNPCVFLKKQCVKNAKQVKQNVMINHAGIKKKTAGQHGIAEAVLSVNEEADLNAEPKDGTAAEDPIANAEADLTVNGQAGQNAELKDGTAEDPIANAEADLTVNGQADLTVSGETDLTANAEASQIVSGEAGQTADRKEENEWW